MCRSLAITSSLTLAVVECVMVFERHDRDKIKCLRAHVNRKNWNSAHILQIVLQPQPWAYKILFR
jgi:hypothetical protein